MRAKPGDRRAPAPFRHAADVAMRTAAKELGLRPKEFELAVQTEHVRTVPGPPGGARRVPRQELERIKGAPDFPGGLRERLRVMGASEASELLDISPARFARLARAGCFGPASFYVNRYRTVVWLYLVAELRDFAENNPTLLTGRLPAGMRAKLQAGTDHRARCWRQRRLNQLVRHAAGPWEQAAVRASVLDDATIAEAVPDPGERARLETLRPCFLEVRSVSKATRDTLAELCLAEGEEEVRWHRFLLDAELETARAAEAVAAAPALRPWATSRSAPDLEEGHPLQPVPEVGARPDPGTARPVAGPPSVAVPRRRWSLLRRRRPKPAARPAR
ncbi:DUF6397 family protein [Streptomyces sp. B15]|uniref:DUF6397 family protein n=1 Tax=Streptomyces sp. B15 TaxID=1537797 RepID=UPI001B37987D|nr:DUF6397 family protein [Streptomyces sp. B15]MBQ1120919.1 hypothetical protein [Streptomyces sp. B15]